MIINISHQKGGTGKSTIAYNLAISLMIIGYKVTLVDTDIQNTVTSINELRETPLDFVIMINDEDELVNFINNANAEDIIIIDSGGFDSSLTRISIMGADINVTPLSDKVTELLAVVKKYSVILEEIEEEIKENVITHILLNKIHPFATKFEHIIDIIDNEPRFKLLTRKIGDDVNFIEIPVMIRDRNIYDKSLIEGYGVCESEVSKLKGHADAKQEINILAQKLISLYQEINSEE